MRTAQEIRRHRTHHRRSVVITTKRGTNQWHGSGAFYERAAALNARLPIENPAPDPKRAVSRADLSPAIGDPMKKDRLWFFSSFEYVSNRGVASSPASQTEFDALASLAFARSHSGISSISVPTTCRSRFAIISARRLDWARSSKSQWFLRAPLTTTSHNALVQQGALPSTGLEQRNDYLNMVISNQHLFSPTWSGNLS